MLVIATGQNLVVSPVVSVVMSVVTKSANLVFLFKKVSAVRLLTILTAKPYVGTSVHSVLKMGKPTPTLRWTVKEKHLTQYVSGLGKMLIIKLLLKLEFLVELPAQKIAGDNQEISGLESIK